MFKFIKKYWPELSLFIITAILCWQNFTPGTILSGWDNLHPEFNIIANIKRSIFSTWQEYQGLGLLAGMAHASDLVRQLIILPLTLFLPQNLIRYLWHFGMLFLGSFGLYNLVRYITKSRTSAWISSLFYLLNFGTVQYFHLAFDPYSTFWGFFPWLILFLFQYLDNPKNLKNLLLINLLATPSFYVQTLFVVYIICISIVFIIHFFTRPKSFHLLNYSSIYLIIFLINSFWLLPNIYFTFTRFKITQNSIQNQIVTDQFVEQIINRGNIKSFGLLQGQYYDLKTNRSKNTEFLMDTWHSHFSSSVVQIFSYITISLSLIGIFSKNKYKKYILGILLFSLIAFLSDTAPFSFINNSLHNLPIINQIFRNSFTKLLVPMVFSLSILLGLSVNFLKKFSYLIPFLIIFVSWPSFQGNFISPIIRSRIPEKYYQLFNYLKTQDSSKRILNLPQYNYWGWYDFNWNYTGSGFIWYGIDQSITDRTFDVWDNNLENLYWQLHYALISQNSDYFDLLLEKYNISYILFDRNLFFNEAANSGKVIFDNENILTFSKKLTLEKKFDNLKLYSVIKNQDNISLYSNLPNISTSLSPHYLDFAFLNYKHYKNNSGEEFYDIFPFNSLTTVSPIQTIKIENDILFSNHNNYQIPLELSWTPCLASNPSLTITAVNEEVVNFYDCGSEVKLDQGHLIKIEYKNILNRPPLVKIFSQSNNRLIIDTKLTSNQNISYLVVPPIYTFDTGLGINISSLSLSKKASTNEIISISFAPFDWSTIASLHFNQPQSVSKSLLVFSHQYNQTFYTASFSPTSIPSQLVLNQSYSPGWIAFYFDSYHRLNLLSHIKINNWANGWEISNDTNSTVYIIFWPQILEFLGFILLLIPLSLFLKPENQPQDNP